MVNPVNNGFRSMSDDLETGISNSPPVPSRARRHLQRLLSFTNHTRNAVTQRLAASLPQNDMERQFAKTAAYASAAVLSAAAYIDLSGKHGSPAGSTLALLSTFISFHYFGVQALYNGREAHGMRTYISSYDKEYPPDLPLYQVRSASGDLPEGSSSSSPALDSQPTVEENDKTYSTHPPPYQDIGQRKPPAQDLPEGSSSGLSTVSNHLILKKNK